jgi:protein-tyrosine phosphatase
MSWIAEERIAIGSVPRAAWLEQLAGEGVTHIVNCRARLQTWISQDLAAERALLGSSRVAYAPMWDHGLRQHPQRWAAATHFAARALNEDPAARVLIHCHGGRRRSVLVAYAVLRLRGHPPEDAGTLILQHRAEARLVRAYTTSVEAWLAAGAPEVRSRR